MSETRKTAETREKDLRLAMFRIKRGRSHTGATRVTIAGVAREAGVSPALIHNHYPTIADAIRVEQGRDSRAQRDAKHDDLKKERERGRELRQEVADLRAAVARLSSINEVLMAKNEALRSTFDQKVVALNPSKSLLRGTHVPLPRELPSNASRGADSDFSEATLRKRKKQAPTDPVRRRGRGEVRMD
jgi:AcrR family transcriptional regulator